MRGPAVHGVPPGRRLRAVRGRAGGVRLQGPRRLRGRRGRPSAVRGDHRVPRPRAGGAPPRRDIGPLRLRLLRPHRPPARAAPGCDGVRLHARGLPPRDGEGDGRRVGRRRSRGDPRADGLRHPFRPGRGARPAGATSAEKGGHPRPGGNPHDRRAGDDVRGVPLSRKEPAERDGEHPGRRPRASARGGGDPPAPEGHPLPARGGEPRASDAEVRPDLRLRGTRRRRKISLSLPSAESPPRQDSRSGRRRRSHGISPPRRPPRTGSGRSSRGTGR